VTSFEAYADAIYAIAGADEPELVYRNGSGAAATEPDRLGWPEDARERRSDVLERDTLPAQPRTEGTLGAMAIQG
jgi:hypothetical protein